MRINTSLTLKQGGRKEGCVALGGGWTDEFSFNTNRLQTHAKKAAGRDAVNFFLQLWVMDNLLSKITSRKQHQQHVKIDNYL